ncbi:hypothetical protein HPB49_021551 [Dermacentor silvarum]|uniref:Uncharacterized protein n=1 Tax=Dermacentor silvarum TaxID=543639 RepID=A0ACB8CSX3_DERSI|nr:hypothetical protein HPB49_021551 [Dermacentor silvarum]
MRTIARQRLAVNFRHDQSSNRGHGTEYETVDDGKYDCDDHSGNFEHDGLTRLHEARKELIAAAAVLSLITVAAVALIVIKIKRVLDAYPLLCTYGMQTNQSTLFPDDGLCDLIFFDSACKDNKNLLSLPSSFSENMNTFLSAARSYRRTDFGVAFAYEYRFKLRVDLKVTNPVPLEELWKWGICDFGIVDMPAFGVKYNDIQDTFTTLKELNAVAERKSDAIRPPYIVLGAVPLASVDDYVSKMKNLFTPTLFISQGHYAFGDSHVPFCHVTPPTLLQKGVAWRDYPYDLTEAVAALKKITDDGGPAKLLVSVGMKSRGTVTKLNERSMYTAPCIYDVKAQPFRSYVEICTDSVWRSRLEYNNIFNAMYAVDQSDDRRFVYDDEYSLCQKVSVLTQFWQGLTLRHLYSVAVFTEIPEHDIVKSRRTVVGRDDMMVTMLSAGATICLVILSLAVVLHLAKGHAESSTTDPDSGLTKAEVVKEALGIETLLCTYGRRTTSDAVMASDGLCDYAFYDSLYAQGRNKLSTGGQFKPDLQTFMRVAAKYNKTTSGVAFAFDYLQEAENDLKQKNPSPLAVFWSSNIFHVGILDTPRSPKPTKWQQAIVTLKTMHDLLDHQRVLGHRSFTVFAGPFPDDDWSRELARYFSELRFNPDLLIVLGHYRFGDNTIENCTVMPPTRHPDDTFHVVAEAYRYDLSNGAFSLREFYTSNGVSRGLLSVTMKGRWTEPKTRDAMDFYSPCLYDPSAESFGSYADVCKHTRYADQLKYSASHYAMLARHATDARAFAYDNEEGLRDKLCRVKRDVYDMHFGIAAYDVDYDDYDNHCSSLNMYGPHSRLKALRKIVDYFRGLIDSRFDERACTSVVT